MRIRAKLMILTVAGAVSALSATAQNHISDSRKSFDEFRKGMLADFKDFRQRLLDHYADFLNGEWHEYESLKGEQRNPAPKPKQVPAVNPVVPSVKADMEKPQVVAPVNETPKVEASEFDFYGLAVSLPDIDYDIKHRLSSTKDYAANWNALKDADIASSVIPQLKASAESMNLNDYLLFRLTESYVNRKFARTDASSRYSLIHFLLVNMGYDVRIAVTASGKPLLLLPFKEKVYGCTYMKLRGENYYVFTPDNADLTSLSGERILTCELPSDGNLGEKFELRLSALNIPEKPKSFSLEYGPLSLKGVVNENLMPILYHYPQMPIEDYAVSVLSPKLRESIAAQVKSQLSSLEGDAKVEALLKFMHNVFEYATDEDNHGFEKPYFLEETLYYPKNDCEDRAIFYTWLLWNALGRESQLITFPGHESATVRMENPVEGTSYTFDGKKYYISDPTYIGSRTGMVMPTYKGLNPEVDFTFRR